MSDTTSPTPASATRPHEASEHVEPNGLVYHYTSSSGLVGIVNSRRGASRPRSLTLFASDLLEMNDATELSFALEIFREHIDGLAADEKQREYFNSWLDQLEPHLSAPTVNSLEQALRPVICATSFTTEDDLLSQWVTYGAGGGFAIGLDASTLRNSTYTGHNVRTEEPFEFGSTLSRVYYGDEARARIAEIPLFTEVGEVGMRIAGALQILVSGISALGDWLKDPEHRTPPPVWDHSTIAIAVQFATQLKHQAFAAEREWRLLVGGRDTGQLTRLLSGHYPPEFRSSGSRLLPYRPVVIKPTEQLPVIRDLVVGPAPDQAQLVHAAQQLLLANDHDPTVVRASQIPYRGW